MGREVVDDRCTHVGAEGAVGRGIPRHLVADLRPVGERFVNRALGDDNESGVVAVEELETGELAREAGAARALPLLAGEPHVVVHDQLAFAFERIGQPSRSVGAVQDVFGKFDHRESPTSRCDSVELACRGLLPDTELRQCRLPGGLIDDRWNGDGFAGPACSLG